ncbi:MAG: hypothetical protein LBL13_09290, partial [Bacteroidales bacterium]|nr:hypothetical protein [Bacteroidales bacterium]
LREGFRKWGKFPERFEKVSASGESSLNASRRFPQVGKAGSPPRFLTRWQWLKRFQGMTKSNVKPLRLFGVINFELLTEFNRNGKTIHKIMLRVV